MNRPVIPWPNWIEGPGGLLAKSADLSEGDEPESLAQHTWLVLSRLANQYRLRPGLAEQVDHPRLWHQAFWACFLHDFGKAAAGFQAVLRGESDRWQQRHEVLSLAFVGWLFPTGHPDRLPVIAAIASHHKNAGDIYVRYLEHTEAAQEALNALPEEVDEDTLHSLWQWLDQCPRAWTEALGFSHLVEFPELLPCEQAQASFGVNAIQETLREYDHYVMALEDDYYTFHQDRRLGVVLRGLIFTADHSASAHAPDFPALRLSRECVSLKEDQLYNHQLDALAVELGSTVMIAPTGSGKTEAAILWAFRQYTLDKRPAPRLFYTLPYQASMNAMYSRLKGHFPASLDAPEGLVGIQHGRAIQSLYYDLLGENGIEQDDAFKQAQARRNLAYLNYFPVRVFSPYQMLKTAYSLKGFEALLLDLHGGLFIFDEIHAYEPERLALIVELIGWLARHFDARFLIMTATLPPTVEQVVHRALPGCQTIQADQAVFERSRRHIVRLIEGELPSESGIQAIVSSAIEGRSVLVCLSTVQRAIDTFEELRKRLPDMDAAGDIVLLHGRFNGCDRKRWEAEILSRVKANQPRTRPLLAVTTQVVEVSLDVDFDTIYTEPAPLEALLQRFGRVNRKREVISLADVHVFAQPLDGQYIYPPDLVQASIALLEDLDGKPIDEAQVSDMLARIYDGEIGQEWHSKYNQTADSIRRVLDGICPFKSAESDIERQYYQLFDGVDVLPLQYEDEYKALREDGQTIEASALFVSMSYGQYQSLERKGLAWPTEDRHYYLVDMPYSPQKGLDLSSARKQKGVEFESEDY